MRDILELASWAPSADNTQPWRFEITSETTARIHSFDLSKINHFDYHGNYSHFGLGCFLETLEIAATSFYHPIHVAKSSDSVPGHLIYDAHFDTNKAVKKDPLADFIIIRVTNRFPLQRDPLSEKQKQALAAILPQGWKLLWKESLQEKFEIAKLMYRFDLIASPATSGIIEWNATYSKILLPDESLGLDAFNLACARWVFESPARIKWFMHYLGGAYISAFLAFFLPGILCGGHFALVADHPLQTSDEYVEAGRIFQRLWLKAAELNLFLQMETGPIVFSRYVRDQVSFASDPKLLQRGQRMERHFASIFGEEIAPKIVMLARIGKGTPPRSRAVRLSFEELIYNAEEFKKLSGI